MNSVTELVHVDRCAYTVARSGERAQIQSCATLDVLGRFFAYRNIAHLQYLRSNMRPIGRHLGFDIFITQAQISQPGVEIATFNPESSRGLGVSVRYKRLGTDSRKIKVGVLKSKDTLPGTSWIVLQFNPRVCIVALKYRTDLISFELVVLVAGVDEPHLEPLEARQGIAARHFGLRALSTKSNNSGAFIFIFILIITIDLFTMLLFMFFFMPVFMAAEDKENKPHFPKNG